MNSHYQPWVVESQLFTSSLNIYHQRLPDIELDQMSAFFQLLAPGSNPVSLLESESELEIGTGLVDTGKRPSSNL
jgi:hypothetical protein